jgi:hypothetical protein
VNTGLVPMLMTHGQTLLEHPAFLERLMIEGGRARWRCTSI